ncbi:Gfo/Idh/MocA family oxidoreductase [bacterium]|nr:Gfo/Idh/MocA family oxidoreductase [bacterium]
MNPVRFALVGTGGRGQIYVDVLKRMAEPRAVWTAMCDRNEEVLNAFCDRNALTDVPRLTSVDDLVRRNDVDAVLVCTPDYAHRAPAETCFGAGLHCLVEKPVATSPEDVRAICAAAQRSGKLLHLGFVFRYDPCALKLRELISGGVIGRLIACITHEAVGWFHGSTYMRRWNRFRKMSGDMLLHKGCHTFDLINFITGAYPLRVAAFGGTEVFRPRPEAAQFCKDCTVTQDCLYYTDQGPAYRDRFYHTAGPQVLPDDYCVYNVDKDTTDTTSLTAEYSNGMKLSYTMTMVSPQGQRRMTFIGTHGEIRCDMDSYQIELMPLPDRPTEIVPVERPEGYGHQHHDLCLTNDFLDRLKRGDDPREGILDAYMSGAVAFAALESMATGQIVEVPPL